MENLTTSNLLETGNQSANSRVSIRDVPIQAIQQHSIPSDPLDKVKIPEDLAHSLRTQTRDWSMSLQLNSSSITTEELKTEIQKCWQSLTERERKCKQYFDKANELQTSLSNEQKRDLVWYHMKLLHAYCDFLQATQYPIATSEFLPLATKHMAARLWEHGIYDLLVLLRRSEAQEHMTWFLVSSYQMMTVLYETVPILRDIWLECLGDLARCWMAVEEDEDKRLWSIIAAGWYSEAADRQPYIGRLNHLLGFVEESIIKRVFLYSKSLTCLVPFKNARNILGDFYNKVLKKNEITNSSSSAEATIVVFYALQFSKGSSIATENALATALKKLSHLKPQKLQEIGALLTITNIAAIFEHGSSTNELWQLHYIFLRLPASSTALAVTRSDQMALDFMYCCSNEILTLRNDRDACIGALPAVHTVLVFFCSLVLVSQEDDNVFKVLMSAERFKWVALCDYLNAFANSTTISDWLIGRAYYRIFPNAHKGEFSQPLPEDYQLQGLIFSQWYHPPNFFDARVDTLERSTMSEEKQKAQVKRVLWLGLFLAFWTKYLNFDVGARRFSTPPA